MFTELNVFKIAYSMASHAGTRQALVSQNIANANTPNYHTKDIRPFKEVYARRGTQSGDMVSTRASHLNGQGHGMEWAISSDETGADPNGNSVSLEQEILKGVEVRRQHSRAISIYKSTMNVLRTSIRDN
ncbi:FlgB family protein [Epibacterium sp. SM1969]|uniref:FlgB family protein n=1 Tax=Tritonibacter aquimaris TaxID=2663379 RepID=A0A844AK80_9RHOB|nr:FlgB family protein [Tritonibacter aquimaris]